MKRFFCISVFLLTLISCSNLFEPLNIEQNQEQEQAVLNGETQAYIKLSLGNESNARTVLPDITKKPFGNIFLNGSKEGQSTQTLAWFKSVEQMQNITLPVSPGNWSFTLTAEQGSTKFKDTITKTIVAGENSLSFNLKIYDFGKNFSNFGSFSITLDYSSAENKDKISYVEVSIENQDGTPVNVSYEKNPVPTNGKVVISSPGLNADVYRVKVQFFATKDGTDYELGVYRELVQISNALTSTAERTITSFDNLYTVTCNLNGGQLPEGTTITETVTRKSPEITLPDLTRRYYTFGGWYTDEDFTESKKITVIKNAEDNVSVWAKWTPIAYNITYVLNGGTNPEDAVTSYTVEDGLVLKDPTFDDKTFYGWYTREDLYGPESFGWDQGTCYEDITFYANWEGYKVTAQDIVERIATLKKPGNLKVFATGAFENSKIGQVNQALKTLYDLHDDIFVSLDLSGTTGITSLDAGSDSPISNSFYGCSNLVNLILPQTITSMGSAALAGCSSLTDLTIPFAGSTPDATTASAETLFGFIFGTSEYTGGTATNQLYKTSQNVTYYIPASLKRVIVTGGNLLYGAFSSCANLTDISIPDTVTAFMDYSFNGCSSLTGIAISDSVTSIGSYAFSGCSSLTNMTIPNLVTSIGTYAFAECSNLENVTIGNNVQSIGTYAFTKCTNLKNVTIGDNVNSIGDDAFNGCSNLETVVNTDNIKSIGRSAFYECTKLKSFVIPNGVPAIEQYTFYKCTSLKNLSIGNTVTRIRMYAFDYCSSLESVEIPDSVVRIESQAFSFCSSITNLTLGNNLLSIGEYAFDACSKISSITIPESVMRIEKKAFMDCHKLTNVTFAKTTGWSAGDVSVDVSDPSTAATYLKKTYSSSVWNLSGVNLVIPEGTTVIDDSAYSGCAGIVSVSIPDSVIAIGKSAFSGCRGLTSVILPSNLESIGESAFNNCSSLASVTIGASVTTIGQFAFQNCTSITSITIPESVTSIGSYAFKGCSALSSATFENTSGWEYLNVWDWEWCDVDVSDPSVAATNLTTGTPSEYSWKRN